MKKNVMRKADAYAARHRCRRLWQKIVVGMACIVVFCTVYALILPAITLEKHAEHTHTEACYTKVTVEERKEPTCSLESLQLHKHTAACYDEKGEPVCGWSDFVVHIHNAACYDENGNLWCPLPVIRAHTHDESCYAQPQEPHIHTDACYTTEPGELICGLSADVPHVHTDNCYEERETLLCGQEESEGHEHSADCYDEEGRLTCIQEETKGHHHSGDCYEIRRELICEFSEGVHRHTDACYAQNPVLSCGLEEGTAAEEPELICGEKEIILHTHTDSCYNGKGTLVCGKQEVRAHIHSEKCFTTVEITSDPNALTCTIPEGEGAHIHGEDCYDEGGQLICGREETEGHQHGPLCYGTWKLTCGQVESEQNETEIQDDSMTEADAAEVAVGGRLKLNLLYEDMKAQSEYPGGFSAYTHDSMSGYIQIEPENLTENLTDITITLRVPKQYVERHMLNLPDFTTTSASIHQMLALKEDEDAYIVGIHFDVYDKTESLTLPFTLSFLDDKTPDTYQLPVTATVSYEGYTYTTEPNLYKPLYNNWEIVKFVNSNTRWAFSEDYAEAVVTPREPDGNPYLDDLTYVDFQFLVNGYNYYGQAIYGTGNRRDVDSITLTDTLPVYTDINGVQQIARFDPEKNPTWTLSTDGTKVSKTYTGANSGDVLKQISEDEPLHLQFPKLPFKKDNDGFLIADLINHVRMDGIPSNMVEGEQYPAAKDSLIFRLTSKDGTEGKFVKSASKGDIYDSDSYKTNGYPWLIHLYNENTQPLRHITIRDREIIENGETVLGGLDKRLKFIRLEAMMENTVLPEGKTFADVLNKITAYYTDGSTAEYQITDVNEKGGFSVVFDESKVCEGFEILFDDAYEIGLNQSVAFYAYTVYRDPHNTHVDENNSQNNIYENRAQAINWWTDRNGNVNYRYLWVSDSYRMLPFTENLRISKDTGGNKDNNTIGSEFYYSIRLIGSLLDPEVKQYKNMRVIDLLPPELTYTHISLGANLFGNLSTYKPEIIENYHNSGRTALIFHFEAEDLIEYWKTNIYAPFTFHVKINTTAKPGTVRNDIYVVGDNLDDYHNDTGGAVDIYDLDDDGRTDDLIAYASSNAVIVAAQSIYAEKFIAPANGSNWTKQGLFLKAGTDFDYLLKITNDTTAEHTGLVVYDTLPDIGDGNIFLSGRRGSEFTVRLRGPIAPPEGYTVYYTTSRDAYSKTMQEMVAADVWDTSPSDYTQVTAFKLVAEESAVLAGNSSFQVCVPVCVASELSESSMELLHGKESSYLEAVNAFGFHTEQAPFEKESNSVWARIPFAEFFIRKVDSQSGKGLKGAVFTLTDEQGRQVQVQTSDEEGAIRFKDLSEGTYTLTETKAPSGYYNKNVSLTVHIVQNAVTMEYTVTFSGTYSGSGTAEAPLLVENESGHELPETGGSGSILYTAGGLATMLCAGTLLLYKDKKRRKKDTFSF